MVLRGVENVELYKELAKPARLVMILPLLKILGHQIAKSEWSTCDKQTVWTVCTVAFFGPFRLGELLSKNEKTYNRVDTLIWGDLTFRKKSVIIHIRVPKCRQRKGESIEIFRVPNVKCYPEKAISRLRDVKSKMQGSHSQVFIMEAGTLLTPALMKTLLNGLVGVTPELVWNISPPPPQLPLIGKTFSLITSRGAHHFLYFTSPYLHFLGYQPT